MLDMSGCQTNMYPKHKEKGHSKKSDERNFILFYEIENILNEV